MAALISFAQAAPRAPAARAPDGFAGDGAESPRAATFLSALREVLGGGGDEKEKTEPKTDVAENDEENPGERQKAYSFPAAFFGPRAAITDESVGVSPNGDAAGAVSALESGAGGDIPAEAAGLPGKITVTRNLPKGEIARPTAEDPWAAALSKETELPRETPLPEETPLSEETSPPQETVPPRAESRDDGSAPARADLRIADGARPGGRESFPESAPEPVPTAEAPEPALPEGMEFTAKNEGDPAALFESGGPLSPEAGLSYGELRAGETESSGGGTCPGGADLRGQDGERPDPARKVNRADTVGAAGGMRTEFSEVAGPAGETAETGAASPEPEAREACLQVSDRIAKELKNGSAGFVMKLCPRGLGEISVRLGYSDGGVSIRMEASAEETLRAIESRSGELRAALQAHNIQVGELHVGAGAPDLGGFSESFSMDRQGFGGNGASERQNSSYPSETAFRTERDAVRPDAWFAGYDDGRLNDRA